MASSVLIRLQQTSTPPKKMTKQNMKKTMKINILSPSLVKFISVSVLALAFTQLSIGSVTEFHYGSGDVSVPGGVFTTGQNLFQTSLASATIIPVEGQDSFYWNAPTRDTTRLYDGILGNMGRQGGSDSNSVMLNVVTLQFNLDTINNPNGYTLNEIKTYASWDSGRSGQGYSVKVSTVQDPTAFTLLHQVNNWNNTQFPVITEDYGMGPYSYTDESLSSTLTVLTNPSGSLADNVASVQFIFNGYQNGGTAYREFQVSGVPEPSALSLFVVGLGGLALVRRRRS